MRYFLEVSYKGTHYAGFQVQQNAPTIQAELEKALSIFYQAPFSLTGSSRTDAGVHAVQNFFHVDTDMKILPAHIYNINAILPQAIVLKAARLVQDNQHCRFNALSRQYKYYIYSSKNPFINETAWFYPYPVDVDLLQQAAEIIKTNTDFSRFAKRNSQVKTHNCTILESHWAVADPCLVYNIKANRFLRGMVRALVATMLKVGRGKLSLKQLNACFTDNNSLVDFSAPPQGLFLVSVTYPTSVFSNDFIDTSHSIS